MRVALYLRVSTDEQAKGHSLDSQRDTLREWARAEEWNPVSEYEDPGASGTSVDGRPGFQRMIDEAEAGRFDAVLVLKLDRFARNRGDAAIYRKRVGPRSYACGARRFERGDGRRQPSDDRMGLRSPQPRWCQRRHHAARRPVENG